MAAMMMDARCSSTALMPSQAGATPLLATGTFFVSTPICWVRVGTSSDANSSRSRSRVALVDQPGRARGRLGAGLDQVGHGLGLGQVELVVEEGALDLTDHESVIIFNTKHFIRRDIIEEAAAFRDLHFLGAHLVPDFFLFENDLVIAQIVRRAERRA